MSDTREVTCLPFQERALWVFDLALAKERL